MCQKNEKYILLYMLSSPSCGFDQVALVGRPRSGSASGVVEGFAREADPHLSQNISAQDAESLLVSVENILTETRIRFSGRFRIWDLIYTHQLIFGSIANNIINVLWLPSIFIKYFSCFVIYWRVSELTLIIKSTAVKVKVNVLYFRIMFYH